MVLSIPVEQIRAEARQVDVRKALLAVVRVVWTVILALPYAAGWTLRKVWIGLAMLGTAAAVGWSEAGRAREAKAGADV